jgi:hypothetical protein
VEVSGRTFNDGDKISETVPGGKSPRVTYPYVEGLDAAGKRGFGLTTGKLQLELMGNAIIQLDG